MANRFKDTLLLIGNGDSERAALRNLFESKFYILEAETAAQGVLLLQQNRTYIAAVVADIPMEDRKGQEALAAECGGDEARRIPLITIVPATGTGANEEYAFIMGATDVVLKPYTTLAITRRVQILVDLYMHQWDLQRLADEQNETIRKNNQIMVDTLSTLIERRSTESGNHVLRIRMFTKILLEALSVAHPEYGLTEKSIDAISSASALHDIGKIAIADSILGKPGKLTDAEFEIMKTHTTEGGRIVEGLWETGDREFVRYSYNIALYHHERYDGGGYPKGLAGEDIPICAQVVGLTDAFDALTTQRVYKPAYPYDTAVNMILNGECGVFSPKLLECFKRSRELLVNLANQYADGRDPNAEDIRVPLPGPVKREYALNSLEMSQRKYQALLHYCEDTVIELDINNGIFHVVYNPNPDLISLFSNVSFRELSERLFHSGIHPEDRDTVSERYGDGMLQIFRRKARTFRFRCRMYSPPHDDYIPYEITLQRIYNEGPDSRMLLAIFHKLEEKTAAQWQGPKSIRENPAMYDLMAAAVCCLPDEGFSIREGAASLTPITGFTVTELWTRFGDSLMNLAVPEDRETLRTQLQSRDIRGGRKEFRLHLHRRDGSPVCTLCRCRTDIGPDGSEYHYMTLTDIETGVAYERKLRQDIQRNQTILDQSGSILFDWELATDQIWCSDRWQERFGYPMSAKGFSRTVRSSYHVHPDDLPLLRSAADSLLKGEKVELIEIRIANAQGRYFWSRIRGIAMRDDYGKMTHIIGAIYDIDQLKNDALSMRRQAQRDALTKLLNKASTQRSVSEYLAERQENSVAAILVMDLDNFKTVNDSLGHYYGDAVLNQVGSILKSLFRAHDILGRIGGDEFMILLKDLPDAEVAESRCRLLVDTMYTLLHKLMPNLPVSVSVGAALAPHHGNTYQELYRRADEALYHAKRKGKNRYSIYDPRKAYGTAQEPEAHTTRIDSESREIKQEDSVAQFVFRKLYESRDIGETISEILGFIGIHFNVSRVYIFENNVDNTRCSNTFEWCNAGIEPQIEALQDLDYAETLEGLREMYEENSILYSTDISELPENIRRILEPQGIRSMLHCAILDRGEFRGFVGFDECTANHLWTQGQVNTLKLLASILCVFVTKLRSLEKDGK